MALKQIDKSRLIPNRAASQKVSKNADTYNKDVLGELALVINDSNMSHKQKQERILLIVDAVYVDGWNHGYKMVAHDQRESNRQLRGIRNGQVSE